MGNDFEAHPLGTAARIKELEQQVKKLEERLEEVQPIVDEWVSDKQMKMQFEDESG